MNFNHKLLLNRKYQKSNFFDEYVSMYDHFESMFEQNYFWTKIPQLWFYLNNQIKNLNNQTYKLTDVKCYDELIFQLLTILPNISK